MKNKTFKTFLLLLTGAFISANIVGQSVKDFYIPSKSNYNKASFYSPNPMTGERTEMTRVIYYVKNDDGNYDVTDAHLFQGQPSSILTQTVLISTTEIKMNKSVSTSVVETNQKQSYSPPRVLLKMPLTGKTATWTFAGEEGDKPTIFISSWTTVTVDGVNLKAIKVISHYTGWKSKTALFYVQGIGLYKTEFIGEDGKKTPFENFDELTYEQTE